METGKIVGIGLLSVLVFSFWASILYGTYMKYDNQFIFSEPDYGIADRVIIKKDGAFNLYVQSADLNDSIYAVIDIKHFVFAMYNQEIVQPNVTATGQVEGTNMTITIAGTFGCNAGDVNGPNMMICSSRVVVSINRNLPIQLEIVNDVGEIHIDLTNQTIESIIMKEGNVGAISIDLNSANVNSFDCGGSIVGNFIINAKNANLGDFLLKDVVGNVQFYAENSSFGYLNYSITGQSAIELKESKLNAPATIQIDGGVGEQRITIIQSSSTNHNLTIRTREITGDVQIREQINVTNTNLVLRADVGTGQVQTEGNLNITNGVYQNSEYSASKPTIYLDLNVGVGNIWVKSL